MFTKIRAWFGCVRLLATASESLAAVRKQREGEEVLLKAARERAAADLIAIVRQCNHASEVLLGLDAESRRRTAEIARLRQDAIDAYAMRHYAVTNAVRAIEHRGAKMMEDQRAKAHVLGRSIVADAEETSRRLIAGAEGYVASLYNANVDDVLDHMKKLH